MDFMKEIRRVAQKEHKISTLKCKTYGERVNEYFSANGIDGPIVYSIYYDPLDNSYRIEDNTYYAIWTDVYVIYSRDGEIVHKLIPSDDAQYGLRTYRYAVEEYISKEKLGEAILTSSGNSLDKKYNYAIGECDLVDITVWTRSYVIFTLKDDILGVYFDHRPRNPTESQL